MRQSGPTDAHHAEDVDVEDPVPLLVGVVLDGADGADARVVHEDVQTAEPLDGLGDRGPYGDVVSDVGLETEQRGRCPGGVDVEDGHRGAPCGEQPGGGQPDAGRAPGDDRPEPAQFAPRLGGFTGRLGRFTCLPGHATSSRPARSAAQNVPSG